jgi:CxxC motif-containing protein (DUF1111 family)
LNVKLIARGLIAAIFISLQGCSDNSAQALIDIKEQVNAGGIASVGYQPFARFDLPAPTLTNENKSLFYAGRALAHQPWVKAPTSTTARDGLGPIFNARSCLGCHLSGGRGRMPEDESDGLFTAFVRLSVPGNNLHTGVTPEPSYGDQLQTQSVGLFSQLGLTIPEGELAPEADVRVRWHYDNIRLADGGTVERRRPELLITQLSDGPLHPESLTSLRNAPGMFGMGLIAAIPQTDIDGLADPLDANNDGISGRRNQVWNPVTQTTEPGRFGWKANRPDLPTIIASAFAGDIGITNPIFPNQPCSSIQVSCQQQPNGNDKDGFELPHDLLELTVNFVRDTAVPKARVNEHHIEGRDAFISVGCQHCHQPSFTTQAMAGLPHLSEQKIWPYSDFLLHDMGEELADDRTDFLASGREWRTAPLWGIGLQRKVAQRLSLLHDGRARSVEEAILWHGGEAQSAKEKYMALPQVLRRELVIFVEAL